MILILSNDRVMGFLIEKKFKTNVVIFPKIILMIFAQK